MEDDMTATCPRCKIDMELTAYDTEDELTKYSGTCDNCGKEVFISVEEDEDEEEQDEFHGTGRKRTEDYGPGTFGLAANDAA